MKFSVLSIMMGVTSILILGGCEEDASETLAEKAIESATQAERGEVDVNLNLDGGTMSISTPEGEMRYKANGESMVMMSDQAALVVGTVAKVPDDFPKDIPIYPGFKVLTAMTLGLESTFSLSGTVSASFDEVKTHYQKEAQTQGWQETISMTQARGLMLAYEKGGRTFQITATMSSGDMALSITTAKK